MRGFLHRPNHPLNHGNSYWSRSIPVIAIVASILDCVVAVAPIDLHPILPQQSCPLVSISGHLAGDLHPLTKDSSTQNLGHVPCLFRIKVPFTKPGDVVKIIGSADSIGHWKTEKALALTTSKLDFPWYFMI